MPIRDFDRWEAELIETGRIVQDGEDSIAPDEAERRCLRYVALVQMLSGTEGPGAARALLRSIQVDDDYEVYEVTKRKFFTFPDMVIAAALVTELPRLIRDLPDHAGDLLSLIALKMRSADSGLIESFNSAVRTANPEVRNGILEFIRRQEDGGWLAEDKKGRLGI